MKYNVECIACGTCYNECVLQKNAITKKANGIEIDLSACNACGHCVAVCPTGALKDHPRSALQSACGAPLPPEEMLRALRYPRSVRHFSDKLVPRTVMEQLLDAGRYTQTAGNYQRIGYLVLSGRENVQKVADLYEELVLGLPDDDPKKAGWLGPIRKRERGVEDGLFYGCSQLVFETCGKDHWDAQRSPLLCQHYLALMAPSLGLGTCWSGQMESLMAYKDFGERFAKLVGLEEEKKLCGCLMVGYPTVQFHRLVARNPLEVSWRGEEI